VSVAAHGLAESHVVFQPMGDRILVLPDPAPEKTPGGLYIPDRQKYAAGYGKCQSGRVVAMGPGMLTKRGDRWPMPDVRPGDRIFFMEGFGQKIKLGEVEHIVLHDDDLIAVEEPS
jgi:chaperonin GroES